MFATVLMLDAGLKRDAGRDRKHDNVVVIRRGSQTEVQSGIDRTRRRSSRRLPEIATGQDGGSSCRRRPSC